MQVAKQKYVRQDSLWSYLFQHFKEFVSRKRNVRLISVNAWI